MGIYPKIKVLNEHSTSRKAHFSEHAHLGPSSSKRDQRREEIDKPDEDEQSARELAPKGIIRIACTVIRHRLFFRIGQVSQRLLSRSFSWVLLTAAP
jgi:hypothetical protein